MDYGQFKRALYESNNGDVQTRNKAQGKLLKLRGDDPDKYQDFTNKARKETKGQNIVKC